MARVPGSAGVYAAPTLRLDSGEELAPARLGWCRYGPEPAQAERVVLFLHGISASPQALPLDGEETAPDAGWGEGWIGPGQYLDTRTCCVLVPNALGSCFGSSGPGSQREPEHFPAVTIADTVRLQGQWLAAQGITQLDEIIGYSYGGYQAFQWAVAGPQRPRRVVVLASAPRGNGSAAELDRLCRLAAAWQSGDAQARIQWRTWRQSVLARYGVRAWLAAQGCPDPEGRIAAEAARWADRFSPWSMARLRGAAMDFDVRAALASCSVPLFWLRGRTDEVFPPGGEPLACPCVAQATVDGRAGHLSPLLESPAWQEVLCALVQQPLPGSLHQGYEKL
ncbi:MAG: alpha/beta fold hydrolase [Pigmentiphaga sp.]|uniref:alpha/beta fold hydrolase n=1 Tax=Pigmentiphaga sp. TaxID=1977564 RepID=UPI0029A171A4|nr:alpha/beta fold hydrolase [Pigmentiphaga sp.]MDX3904570.1 alpha/beta fold hydrolase [Pigmentiphaga sp.]